MISDAEWLEQERQVAEREANGYKPVADAATRLWYRQQEYAAMERRRREIAESLDERWS